MKKICISGKQYAYKLSVDEYVRWAALIEAMEGISRTAKIKKIDLDKNPKIIKPKKINEYIESRFYSLKHDLVTEEKLHNLSNCIIK